MQTRGDKIAKNKAQTQAIKTARQAGEFKKERLAKKQARKDKRDAMKNLRKMGQEGTEAFNKGVDAIMSSLNPSYKAGTSNITKKGLKEKIKQAKKDRISNINDNSAKKSIKNEYNQKLKTALDARLNNRIAGAQQGVKIGGKVDLGGANLEMQDLSLENQINAIQNKPIKSPNNKVKTPAYKMHPKSPIAKALVGNQHKLPQHLQDAIKAAPGKAYKKY